MSSLALPSVDLRRRASDRVRDRLLHRVGVARVVDRDQPGRAGGQHVVQLLARSRSRPGAWRTCRPPPDAGADRRGREQRRREEADDEASRRRASWRPCAPRGHRPRSPASRPLVLAGEHHALDRDRLLLDEIHDRVVVLPPRSSKGRPRSGRPAARPRSWLLLFAVSHALAAWAASACAACSCSACRSSSLMCGAMSNATCLISPVKANGALSA